MGRKRFITLIGVATVPAVAIAVFGVLAWRSIDVEHVDPAAARARIEAARTTFAGNAPILTVGTDGSVRRSAPPDRQPNSPGRLQVLAYRVADNRLVTVSLPFWFIKMKGPAVKYSLRDTGFDLERLGVTAADLERYGPALVLDETRANGDRLLVWTD